MNRKIKVLIAGSLAVAAIGAGSATTGMAAAAASPPLLPLQVTLSASSDGASAVWDANGNPVLTPGSTASTFAELSLSLGPSGLAPVSPPSFTTDNYAAGSPRWYIQLANGFYLFGYPAQLGGTATASFTGGQWSARGPGGQSTSGYVTYAKALAFADPAGQSFVTKAIIVADGDQAAGTRDTLTGVQYGGATLQVQASNKVVVRNRQSGRCLNEDPNSGLLSQYACNVAGIYHSLQWQLVTFADGSQYLRSVATGRYVQDGAFRQQLSLTGSSLSPRPMAFYNGGIFKFPNNGLVMDNKARGRYNFNPAIGYTYNGGNNQRWDFANAPA